MNIIVIGAGASGTLCAILIKNKIPSSQILLIEKMDKPLKKIYATGNGKCNFGNTKVSYKSFFNSEFVKQIISDKPFEDELKIIDYLGIKTKIVDELLYPKSESAITVANALIKQIEKHGIGTSYSNSLIDYKINGKTIDVLTTKGHYQCDKLIFACGGKSSPQLGSDGSCVPLLLKHGYHLVNFKPALCPIYCVENTHILDGVRTKANVKVYAKERKIFEESGEVLFKDKGLSGIVIFNASRAIAHSDEKNIKIYLDLLQDVSVDELRTFEKQNGQKELLEAYVHPKIIDYINTLKNCNIIDSLKNLSFNFKSFYGFNYSQVSVGGIDVKDVDNHLESKVEPNVYFIGEMLDVDAPCGGLNLTWAFLSAKRCADKI